MMKGLVEVSVHTCEVGSKLCDNLLVLVEYCLVSMVLVQWWVWFYSDVTSSCLLPLVLCGGQREE